MAATAHCLQSNEIGRTTPPSFADQGQRPRSVDQLESAIVATLQLGKYTAIVRGKNSRQDIALAEVYHLDPAADSHLDHISGRPMSKRATM